MAGVSGGALGAEVAHVGKGDPPFVVFGAGSSDDIAKDDEYCVFDDDDQEVACGKVRAVRRTASSFFITEDERAKVRIGMRVSKKGAPPEGRWFDGFEAGLVARFGRSSSFSYRLEKFNQAAFSDPAAPVWTTEGERPGASLGAGLRLVKPVGADWDVAAEVVRTSYPEDTVDVDYSAATAAQHAKTAANASVTRFSAAGRWWPLKGDVWRIGPGAGLTYESASVTMTATVLDDGTAASRKVANAEASFGVLGFAAAGYAETNAGPLVVGGAFTIDKPLALMGLDVAGDASLPAGLPATDGADGGFKKNMQVTTTGLATNVTFYLGYRF